jgi:Spy/CpxP family protein refolding chaperone
MRLRPLGARLTTSRLSAQQNLQITEHLARQTYQFGGAGQVVSESTLARLPSSIVMLPRHTRSISAIGTDLSFESSTGALNCQPRISVERQTAGVAMRILPASTVVGSLLLIGLIGTLPAASQSIRSSPSAASFKMAAVADWKAERDTYVQKARDEVQAWQQKLHDIREKAKTRNSEASITARNNFNAAWTETEDAFHKLETVGAEDWESAKMSFNKASQKLAAIWEKIKT